MKTTASVLSIQVGLPRTYHDDVASAWTTGFFKSPVIGPVEIGPLGIAGDGQADLVNHGGIDKAVLGYSAEHYAAWRQELDEPLPFGGFGENLTILGLTESEVCIGDVWQIGEVRLEVSQPRQPCWKLGRRWNRPTLPKQVIQTGRTGWYYRVMTAGQASAGEILLLHRPHPQWAIADCNQVYYQSSEPAALQELADLAQLSTAWREDLHRKLSRNAT